MVRTRPVLHTLLLTALISSGCRSVPNDETILAAMSARTLGLGYLEEDRFDEAAAQLQRVTELLPNEALGYANLALVSLRTGDAAGAIDQLDEALERDPSNPDILFDRALTLGALGRDEQAVALLESVVESDPGHARARWELAALLRRAGSGANLEVSQLLGQIVGQEPGNIVARLELIETLLRVDSVDAAVAQHEQIGRQIPNLSGTVRDAFVRTLRFARAGDVDAARTEAAAFHNLLRSSPLYRQGVESLIGRPGFPGIAVERFSTRVADRIREADLVSVSVDFSRSDSVRLPGEIWNTGALVSGDLDGDGSPEILATRAGGAGGSTVLLKREGDSLRNITGEAGLPQDFGAYRGLFVDVEDDGDLDVVLTGPGGLRLYLNSGDGGFSRAPAGSGLRSVGAARGAVAGDLDHDGDVDLFVSGEQSNSFLRNDGAGTFTDVSDPTGITEIRVGSGISTIGDFDNDFDVDLLSESRAGAIELISNLRQGRYASATTRAGLDAAIRLLAVADFNNDGFLDVMADTGESAEVFANSLSGQFSVSPHFSIQRTLRVVEIFDFDNDGFTDIAAIDSAAGVVVYRNRAGSGWAEVDQGGMGTFASVVAIRALDFDSDGDLDLAVIDGAGLVRLLSNQGGDINNYLNVRLSGLAQGSNKNNFFGLGATVEVTAGGLYQKKVVTGDVTHFGLGGRERADVVRVVWTNGVPQNSFLDAGNQTVVEEQILKGSCAFLYTWTGDGYEFQTDMMWKSAIGMPLGIMGSAMSYAPPDASREFLLIPGDRLQPVDGEYRIQITEELWEVAYLDQLRLVVYDHPDSIDVFVDEKFVPPFVIDSTVFQVTERLAPLSARDQDGSDLMDLVSQHDFRFVSDFIPGTYQGLTETHDMILELGNFAESDTVRLFLNGWLFPTDASINVALSQSDGGVLFPQLAVRDESGRWVTAIDNMSFPQGKNKTMVVDLTGVFLTENHEVRIRTNMEIYWDYIFYSVGSPRGEVRRTTLRPRSADLHFRGFSRLYRRGGRYGPHWFDYSDVSTERKWLPMTGAYTRYGDVLPLLDEPDDMYVIIREGDELSVAFDAGSAPPLPEAWSRDFLIYSDGFLKDADLNTAEGRTVEPLPFHSMRGYPYSAPDRYPYDSIRAEFVREYNTRVVDNSVAR